MGKPLHQKQLVSPCTTYESLASLPFGKLDAGGADGGRSRLQHLGASPSATPFSLLQNATLVGRFDEGGCLAGGGYG